MLTINATNFGVRPENIQIREFRAADLLILSGSFTVDTTAPEYAGIRPMQISVADLPFAKSRPSSAYVTVESEGAKFVTLTKVWVSDRNTVNIGKIASYKEFGSFRVHLSTALIPERTVGPVVLNTARTCEPGILKGAAEGAEARIVETDGWLMLVFRADRISFDESDGTAALTLPGFPQDVNCEVPVLYNESLWSDLGSKYYPATLQGGVLTIRRDGATEEPAGTGAKFTRFLIVR